MNKNELLEFAGKVGVLGAKFALGDISSREFESCIDSVVNDSLKSRRSLLARLRGL